MSPHIEPFNYHYYDYLYHPCLAHYTLLIHELFYLHDTIHFISITILQYNNLLILTRARDITLPKSTGFLQKKILKIFMPFDTESERFIQY